MLHAFHESCRVDDLLCLAPGLRSNSRQTGQGEPKKPETSFKPIDLKADLTKDDGNDEKLNQPAKKYTVKLSKDKTYLFELNSKDFDPFLRLLDKNNRRKSPRTTTAAANSTRALFRRRKPATFYHGATLDGDVGKFHLKVRELNIKGEAKARDIPAAGFELGGDLGENDETDLGKRTKVISMQLKADQAYLFEIESSDFDCQLYVFDGKTKLLGQDPQKVVASGTANGDHHLVVATFDENVGKFNLKARAFTLKGEAKPREIAKNGLSITDNIGQNDTTELGKLGKVYSVTLKAGQSYTIDLESGTMDSYLYLFDAKTKLLAQDDDSGGDLNSRITFRAERDGVYHIVATSLDGDETGEFTLKVSRND